MRGFRRREDRRQYEPMHRDDRNLDLTKETSFARLVQFLKRQVKDLKQHAKRVIIMMVKNRHDDLQGISDRGTVDESMYYRFQCGRRVVMLAGTKQNKKDRRELEGMILWKWG